MTPREVLRTPEQALHFLGYSPSEVLDDLRSVGFEIVPTTLVDAVLAYPMSQDRTTAALDALAAYRRAPVLLGQTEERQP